MAQTTSSKWSALLEGRPVPSLVASSHEDSRIQSVTSELKLQSLWAGYGSVYRLEAVLEDGSKRQLIVKQVNPPQASGISHKRKLRSYEVEATFYKSFAPLLAQPPTSLPLPQPVCIDADGNKGFTFVLTDLSEDGMFPVSVKDSFSLDQMKAALSWLARFHAVFWESTYDLDGVWECGCFWHLATRQDELQKMVPEWADLKAAAPHIDALLRGQLPDGSFSKRHMTLAHGDIKAANMMFSEDGSRCAAYDFQYTGHAYGAKDVARIFCSSGNQEYLEDPSIEQTLLSHYHTELLFHLRKRTVMDGTSSSTPGRDFSFDLFLDHYEWALVDYVRYMAGWGWGGAHEWAKRRCREIMETHAHEFQ